MLTLKNVGGCEVRVKCYLFERNISSSSSRQQAVVINVGDTKICCHVHYTIGLLSELFQTLFYLLHARDRKFPRKSIFVHENTVNGYIYSTKYRNNEGTLWEKGLKLIPKQSLQCIIDESEVVSSIFAQNGQIFSCNRAQVLLRKLFFGFWGCKVNRLHLPKAQLRLQVFRANRKI